MELSRDSVLLSAGELVDGTGAAAVRGRAVLINEGSILAIGALSELERHPSAVHARRLNFPHGSLLPGLVDGHVHLGSSLDDTRAWRTIERDRDLLLAWTMASARRALSVGVTTLRDCGSPAGVTLAIRRMASRSLLEEPRLLVCGPCITTTAGHAAFIGVTADSAIELRRRVRELAAQGADFIKLIVTGGSLDRETNRRKAQYSRHELAVAISDAHRLGKPVLAHANATEGIRRAVDADVDAIAHCNWLAAEEGCLEYDSAVAARMAERRVFVDLNLDGATQSLAATDAQAHAWDGPPVGTRWEFLADMRARGVPIFFSSDRFGLQVEEFPSMLVNAGIQLGLPATDVIWRASGLAAEGIGASTTGTVQVGKDADLLVVDGSVSEDLAALLRVRAVFARGRLVIDRTSAAGVGCA